MASTTFSSPPLSKLDLSLVLSQRNKKFGATSIPLSSKTHLQKFKIHHQMVRLPHFKSKCVIVSSSLNDQVEDKILPTPETTSNSHPQPEVQTRIISFVFILCSMWNWRGYSIRYQYGGNNGPALVLVHGFGANSDHWRKNIPVLAKSHRVYSIDLIGYGYSDKPKPRQFGDNSFYTFETWAAQLNDFCIDVVKDEAFFICNSIGGLVGLQAAVTEPQICKGIILLNISLRMLHIKKQPWFGRPFIRSFQNLLRGTAVGKAFFRSVATQESVRSILCQCYHDTSQVTDELVLKILNPGLEPGAADVFLEFICYSDGPLPEELLPQVKCPVLIGWGDKDPWEPIELGRNYGNFDSVEDFIVLPNVGHCPQDEAPHLVNPIVESFVSRHAKSSPGTS
ncbi:Alpha/beta hydrolase fold [Quillaja saponaria]|uniref:Alpha/beta hydrolase fold n=1 Tax=Quillaja saponaria TaxID=32244 RepID=A0AAD7QFK6_QUISA|nr:Alpha/beta hydrolase fold [Quillaja saponaria]